MPNEGDTTTTETTDMSTTTQTGTSAGQSEGAGGGTDKPTFTQADVDKIVGERAKRAASTAVTEFLKEVGFEKPEDLKTVVKSVRDQEEAGRSELEKAQKALADERKKREDAEKAAADALAARRQDALNLAIRTAAAEANAQFPEDVVEFVRKGGDLDKLMNEEGVIDTAAVKKRVEAVKKERATWFNANRGPGSPSNSGGRAPEPDAALKQEAKKGLKRQVKSGF